MISPPEDLRQMVRKKAASFIVGAGVSISATNNSATASWMGLLRHGITHCTHFGKPALSESLANQNLNLLASNDTDAWLSIASLIERKLKYPDQREWAKWLKETVGSLTVVNPNLPESILELNLPIITTNYDSIFESSKLSRPLRFLTWTDNYFDQLFLESPEKYIFHLHGHYSRPESIVLGLSSYSKILTNEYVQFFTRLLSVMGGFIFVGYGAGFDDPNFTELLKFVDKYGSTQRHYVLVKKGDEHAYDSYQNIYPVVFGDTFDELPLFIRSLPYGRERFIYFNKKGDSEIINNIDVFEDISGAPKLTTIPPGSYTNIVGQKINITKHLATGICPVTVREWGIFLSEIGHTRRKYIGNQTDLDLPIVGVTYFDAIEYINWLNKITGYSYRLLSESEWEYVSLSNSQGLFWWGDDLDIDKGNFRERKIGTITPVKTFQPNNWGVYDMHGNVWEWVDDNFSLPANNRPNDGSPFYSKENITSNRVDERILKGGCFYYSINDAKSTSRIHLEEGAVFNSVGFRVAREINYSELSNSTYFIVSLSAPYALSTKNGKPSLSEFSLSENQKWKIAKLSNGNFSIKSIFNNMHLSPSTNTHDFSQPIFADDLTGHWSISKTSGGHRITLAKEHSRALDLEGARALKTPDLIFFENHGNFNQIWRFILAT